MSVVSPSTVSRTSRCPVFVNILDPMVSSDTFCNMYVTNVTKFVRATRAEYWHYYHRNTSAICHLKVLTRFNMVIRLSSICEFYRLLSSLRRKSFPKTVWTTSYIYLALSFIHRQAVRQTNRQADRHTDKCAENTVFSVSLFIR